MIVLYSSTGTTASNLWFVAVLWFPTLIDITDLALARQSAIAYMVTAPLFILKYIRRLTQQLQRLTQPTMSNSQPPTQPPPPLPAWLTRAQRPAYLADADRVLSIRESERTKHRRASRHTSHPSATHRLIHRPSTALKDAELIAHYSVGCAYEPRHVRGNRYVDVAPYDRTRVVVGHHHHHRVKGVEKDEDKGEGEGGEGEEETEPAGRYLNASWVRELAGKKWWIATQAPLPDTMHAFLSLIFQPLTRPLDLNPPPTPATGSGPTSRIRTVVQLTRVRESGTQKAHFYFPQRPGESWITPPEPGCHASPLKVTLLESKVVEEAGCVHSLVAIQPLSTGSSSSAEDERERVVFNHMFYEGWPDHDVPSDPHSLLRFALLVDKVNRDLSSLPLSPDEIDENELDPDPPIVVGCSAGIGRTGTFIALSSLLRAHRYLPPTSSILHEAVDAVEGEETGIGESPLGELPEEFREDEVVREVDALREQRPGMVQKLGQMKMVYELLVGVLLAGGEGWKDADSGHENGAAEDSET